MNSRPAFDRDELLAPLLVRYQALDRAIKALNTALASRYVGGAVYQIPFVRDAQPDEATDAADADPSPGIPVTPAHGLHALRLAQRCYSSLKRQHNQPPTRADRLPGYLITRNPDVVHHAAAVNSCKVQFKAAMIDLPPYIRPQEDLFPGSHLQHLMAIQVYRQIDVFDRPLRALTFGWTAGSSVVQQLTREEVAEIIKKSLPESDGVTSTASESRQDKWQTLLENCDSPCFARIKPIPPTPICNLAPAAGSDSDGEYVTSPWLPRHAVSMPIILFAPGDPEIKHLESYLGQTEHLPNGLEIPAATPPPARTSRPRLTCAEPLIGPLRIYAYEPEHYATVIAARDRRLAERAARETEALAQRSHPFDAP